jgi:tetratricopeptide (TPR) repeat protein
MSLQHPDFDRFAQCRKNGQHAEALSLLEKLMAAYPQSAALYWHKVQCLQDLQREEEVPAALNQLLARRPDYAPALIKRVEFTGWELDVVAPLPEAADDYDDQDEAPALAPEEAAAVAKRSRLEAETWQRSVRDLRTVLRADATQHRAAFLLSELLRYPPAQAQTPAEKADAADALLDQALAAAPDEIEYLMVRGRLARSAAMLGGDENMAEAEQIQTFTGMRYSRTKLEAAARDFGRCWQIEKNARHALQLGTVLHDLERFEEALRCYDETLALMAADDPLREYLLERRAASDNNGAGEREQMAALLMAALNEKGGNRTQAEDMEAQALLGAAAAIRRGASLESALAANLSDDPDTMTAMNIAQQILNVANEPAPGLQEVNAARYPAWQRRHADAVAKVAGKLGLIPLADVEAMAMFNMLGQHVLLRLFRDESGETGMASYCLKPKWPGVLGFLLMLFTGKWKVHKMTECVTHFSNGGMITTQPESASPFSYGDKIQVNKLPAKASVADIFQQHQAAVAAYRTAHPGVRAMIALDVAAVEARWVAGQALKRAYRESVGYVTDEELQRMLGAHYERFAGKVRTQLKLMVA